MHSGARATPASWTRSAIPGVLPTRFRRRRSLTAAKRRPGEPGRPPPLIPSLGIDDVLKPRAGFKALDLARHVFRYFVGIGIGCVVRRQDDVRMGPEPAVRRKWFHGEDVQRGGAE